MVDARATLTDKRANWAQNGGVEHEQDVTRMMDYIREYG